MRDLFVAGVVLLSLPLAFRRPFFGLLLFSWLAYMRPQDLCWSFARSMRFSYFAAITMMLGWAAHEMGRRRFWVVDTRTVAMIALTVLVSISFAFAREQTEYEVRYYFEFLKIILIALFTTGQVDTRQRLRVMLWTITLCLGFYGFKGGLKGALTGTPILRGPGGMLEDNNDFALALVMNVPLLYYMGLSENLRWLRRFTLVIAGLSVVTILLTHSRGAFVALCCTLMWIAWRSGHLFRATMTLAALGVLFLALAPQSVLDRLATIREGGAESSAAARLRSWAIALRMIEDNPVLGVGLRNFQPNYRHYAPDLQQEGASTGYVAHNSYLQIWAESGTLAFAIYLILLGSVFFACRSVWRMALFRRHMAWALHYSRMMEATTIAFMVGAVFLNRGHFDLIYHFLALVGCMLLIARREAHAGPDQEALRPGTGTVEVVRAPVLAGTSLPRWERTP